MASSFLCFLFILILICFTWAEGLLETTSLPSQGRSKAAYTTLLIPQLWYYTGYVIVVGIGWSSFGGVVCTWYRENNHVAALRLDRFLVSTKWDVEFNNIKQSLLLRTLSDHIPIVLQCGECGEQEGLFQIPEPVDREEGLWAESQGMVELLW